MTSRVRHERAALSIYTAVPAGSRPAHDVPCTDGGIGQKGSAKLGRVPPAGLSSAERTEIYRMEAITSGPGYHRMYGESTNLSWGQNLSWKPLL
jgi:hypothetical protein